MLEEKELQQLIAKCNAECDRRVAADKILRSRCLELVKAYCKETGKKKLRFDPDDSLPGCTVMLRHGSETCTINSVKVDETSSSEPEWNPAFCFDIDTEYDSYDDLFEWNFYDISWPDLLSSICEAILDPVEDEKERESVTEEEA